MSRATKFSQPAPDCPICPRLAAFRASNQHSFPDYFNAPVPSFGGVAARLLVVGLAPGLRGANRTGRPFTGDYAGDLLYTTLLHFGFAHGNYGASPDDGLALVDCRIANAVRCVPPDNKPTPAEIKLCNPFLQAEIRHLTKLRAILALGTIAHNGVLDALGQRRGAFKFAHGAEHRLPGGIRLYDSYHCSRYNTNTRRLTAAMFEAVVAEIAERLRDQL